MKYEQLQQQSHAKLSLSTHISTPFKEMKGSKEFPLLYYDASNIIPNFHSDNLIVFWLDDQK
jgi:hypothetical protein